MTQITPQQLEKYLLTSSDIKSMATFKWSQPNITISKLEKKSIVEKRAGIYFWVMRWQKQQYKIYIGRTNNFAKRMGDYTNPFQPHSTNDFKLQIFQEIVAKELFRGAELDLYFSEGYIDREQGFIDMYAPLLNNLGKPDGKDKALLEKAYAEYYANNIKRALGLIITSS